MYTSVELRSEKLLTKARWPMAMVPSECYTYLSKCSRVDNETAEVKGDHMVAMKPVGALGTEVSEPLKRRRRRRRS